MTKNILHQTFLNLEASEIAHLLESLPDAMRCTIMGLYS